MELATGHRLLYAILIVFALSAESGLLVLNRIILSAGVYKFPYPVGTTLIQCSITFILALVVEWLIHILLLYLIPRPCSVYNGSDEEESSLLTFYDAGPDSSKSSRESSPQRTDLQRWTVNKRFLSLARLAVIYLLRIVVSNANIVHLPLSTYTLFRLCAVPLAFVFNAILSDDLQSSLAIFSSLLSIFSLALTILPAVEQIALRGMLAGVSMSTLDAVFPILLSAACFERSQRAPIQDRTSSFREKVPLDAHDESRPQDLCRRVLSTLRQVTLLSLVIIIPVFLFCGELQDIQQNSYVLRSSSAWWLLVGSGLVNAGSLLMLSLVSRAMSPVTASFLTVPSSAIIVIVFVAALSVYGWTAIGVCWFMSLGFLAFQFKETSTKSTATVRSTYSLLRGMTILVLLFTCFYSLIVLQQGKSSTSHAETLTCDHKHDLPSDAALSEAPTSAPTIKDDYLGPRPNVRTVANISLMVESCAEVVDGSGVDDVVNCLAFLAGKENEYLTLPVANSTQAGSGTRNSLAIPASASSIGTCPGEIIPFHVYWTGPATWRFELFIKAYLYTQNLPCSRLWIWLDSDNNPGAIDDMRCNDAIFQRFLPLVERGDIKLKQWNLPRRIPIPENTIDKTKGLYPRTRPSEKEDEVYVSDEIVQDSSGEFSIAFDPTGGAFSPVQISDAVRFVVLHLHGGIYLDMDVLLLRDMRPMLLPDPTTGMSRAFAEQWVERCHPSAYNTAVISLPANSSLSTYLLRGGVRMGMNFHPLVIGSMMWHDGRNDELAMLQNAVFDPLVTNLRRKGTTTCTVPCHKNFQSSFMRVVEEPEKEWSNYYGETEGDVVGSFPPTNRTMSHFFRGAWAYHIHNQWWKFPDPASWMDVITRAQDGFFHGTRTNAYGEHWSGPFVEAYDRDGW